MVNGVDVVATIGMVGIGFVMGFLTIPIRKACANTGTRFCYIQNQSVFPLYFKNRLWI